MRLLAWFGSWHTHTPPPFSFAKRNCFVKLLSLCLCVPLSNAEIILCFFVMFSMWLAVGIKPSNIWLFSREEATDEMCINQSRLHPSLPGYPCSTRLPLVYVPRCMVRVPPLRGSRWFNPSHLLSYHKKRKRTHSSSWEFTPESVQCISGHLLMERNYLRYHTQF